MLSACYYQFFSAIITYNIFPIFNIAIYIKCSLTICAKQAQVETFISRFMLHVFVHGVSYQPFICNAIILQVDCLLQVVALLVLS